jgi:2-isopropylmalate synthase
MATAEGNGPFDAAFKAVAKLIDEPFDLDEFLIQAITRGSDDVGKVHVRVKGRGRIFYGFSADTDIVTASVKALVDALNKMLSSHGG